MDAGVEPNPMQQEPAEIGDAGDMWFTPVEPRARVRSNSTAASDRPASKRGKSAFVTMWTAEGDGKIGFSGHDGWDGSPTTDAKYVNLTSYAYHPIVVESEEPLTFTKCA